MSRNAWLIARRELRERVRKTSFKVTTALGVLLIAALFLLPAITDKVSNSSRAKVVVVGADPAELATLQRALPDRAPNGKPTLELQRVGDAAAGRRKLDAGDVDGLLVLGAQPSYRADDVSGDDVTRLRGALAALAAQQRLADRGLDAAAQQAVFAPVPLRTVDADGKVVSSDSRALVYALLLMLYLSILVYGAAASSAIVGEKASRVTEVMLSRVTPVEHLAGKLGGVGLAGLLQYVVWIVTGLAILAGGSLLGASAGVDLANVPVLTLLAFGVFFVLGFALYGTLYAAFSAPASRIEDATTAGVVPGLLIVVSFFAASTALGDPESGIARVFSLIPPLAPMTMFTRVALGSPPVWEVALSVVLLVATIALVLVATAKVYRAAILTYGTKPTPGSILRLVRAS